MGPFPHGLGEVKAWLMLELPKIIRGSAAISFPIVFILFYDQRLAGRSVENYEKRSFFSVFSRLGPFPLDFGQVKE